VRLSNHQLIDEVIFPEDAGLERAPMQVVTGGDIAENADRFRALMNGLGGQSERDMVILNAAVLLRTAGKASDLREGAGNAREALLSGGARKLLNAYVEASNG
jgi:anthranilate phosphoribosyltransferase